MTIRHWKLAGVEDDRLFSPYCWRVRMALAHKRLQSETVPWRFTEKEAIAFSGQEWPSPSTSTSPCSYYYCNCGAVGPLNKWFTHAPATFFVAPLVVCLRMGRHRPTTLEKEWY